MKNHLVLLGVKANSWAWGLEQSLALKKSGENVWVVDFDLGANKGSPRIVFQNETLAQNNIYIIRANEIVTKDEIKKINSKSRKWVTENVHNAEWIDSTLDELPIGRIVMSNYARIAGTRHFKLNLVPKNLQRKIVYLSLLADLVFGKIQAKFSDISISNGRSPIEAVFLFRTRQSKKRVSVMERGASTKQWFTYKTSPHFAPDWWEMLKKVLDETPLTEINKVSASYWETRLSGWDELSGRDWSKEFETGKVPATVKEKSVMFFCTSQHEVPVIEEFECSNLGYENQQSAVRELIKVCNKLGKNLIVKRHPNSVAVDGVDREEEDWLWLSKEKGVTYIDPKSKVDTYALLSMAECAITFKSSVGVEASALGIPARSMGPAEWAFLEETRVWDSKSLDSFIKNPTVLNSDVHQAWGYLVRTFGQGLNCFSDITGGYVLTNQGYKIYSADYYDRSIKLKFSRVRNKLWDWKVRIFSQ